MLLPTAPLVLLKAGAQCAPYKCTFQTGSKCIDGRFSKLESRMNNLETRIDKLETFVSNLSTVTSLMFTAIFPNEADRIISDIAERKRNGD